MSNWALGLFTLFLTGLGIVTWYFVDLWIKSVESALRKNSNKLSQLSLEVKNLKDHIDPSGMAKTLHSLLQLNPDFPSKKQIEGLQETLQQTNLKLEDSRKESHRALGKVILIEEKMEKQEKKLRTMYDVLTAFIKKTPNG